MTYGATRHERTATAPRRRSRLPAVPAVPLLGATYVITGAFLSVRAWYALTHLRNGAAPGFEPQAWVLEIGSVGMALAAAATGALLAVLGVGFFGRWRWAQPTAARLGLVGFVLTAIGPGGDPHWWETSLPALTSLDATAPAALLTVAEWVSVLLSLVPWVLHLLLVTSPEVRRSFAGE